MKVQIEDNLYIESDERQFVIKEYTGKTDKKGTPLFKTHGYYTKVEFALKKLLQMKVKESTATNLAELIQDIKRIERYIEQIMPV